MIVFRHQSIQISCGEIPGNGLCGQLQNKIFFAGHCNLLLQLSFSCIRMIEPQIVKGVNNSAVTLAILYELDVLRLWARENPPDGGRVVLAGIAKPKRKSASGTEDFALTLRVEEL